MIRLFLLAFLLLFTGSDAWSAAVRVARVDGGISPVTAEYLRSQLRRAAADGAPLFLVEIDTPGGLDTAMREIVKEILTSPVPVAVHVTPSGARAASAGAIIGLSADILAMSPGTNIGAAHPVSLGGDKPDKVMEGKIVNDAAAYAESIAARRGRNVAVAVQMVRDSLSLPAEQAVALRIADLTASTRTDLLAKLEGRTVTKERSSIPLRLAGVPVEEAEMTLRQRILAAVSNPNVAYLLLMAGLIGIFFELSNPGVVLPGVIGGISLILALFAFQTLPVNYAGVLLVFVAVVLFIAEIQIVSHGMLAVAGSVSLLLGSLMLFDSPEPYLKLSLKVLIPVFLLSVGFILFAVTMAVKAQRRKPSSGREGLVGETGVAASDLSPEGKVFLHGEYWNAVAEAPVVQGEKVVVTAVDGLRVRVRKG